jgi:hypothetical protein
MSSESATARELGEAGASSVGSTAEEDMAYAENAGWGREAREGGNALEVTGVGGTRPRSHWGAVNAGRRHGRGLGDRWLGEASMAGGADVRNRGRIFEVIARR